MNCIDVIFFQAELAPEKVALVAQGAITAYGRLAQGIVSAQNRLIAAGLREGQTVGLDIAHPIDQFVLACALYRMKIASASIAHALDAYLDNVAFDAVLADSVIPDVSRKQPAARLFVFDTKWFQDQVTFGVAERTRPVRDPEPDWIARIACDPNDPRPPAVVRATSRALEAQLMSYCVSAPSDWERMISVLGLNTLSGFVMSLAALWLGRSLCFADFAVARNMISVYRHHYLVASTEQLEPLLALQAKNFIALPTLRGAWVQGTRFTPDIIANCLATISSNTVISYNSPVIGTVAYAAAARIRNVSGAVGFLAPWVEVEVVGNDRAPLAAEQEGELRFRGRGEQRPASAAGAAKAAGAEWIYPGQRARVLKNNLLVIC